MSIEARQIQKTLYSYAAILNFTPSPQGLRAKFGACSVQNAQLLLGTNHRDYKRIEAASQDELRDKLNKSNGGQI